ncbi:DUF2806 domain-containing protein [Buttiauxella sp. A111]|uniref:DUF2806 domain-containing protein n=1 Tax=Buttiauxella sp. A111 TaxID=2563088 RepID=UPI0010E58ADB|nr:DUF2806 domain-containing protein [Buttiauxella sp. A111]GDX05744.1 DUF2806 domain-containing protein [Buttiauxella sp. A111]
MFGSKLATKMWETAAEKGIGGLFKPWQMRREGNTSIELKRKEMLIIAQTEKDIEGIKKGEVIVSLTDINNPKLISMKDPDSFHFDDKKEPHLDIKSLMLNANNYSIANEIQKEINVTKALYIAEDILSLDQSDPLDDEIEADWLIRWRDSAATTSSEHLQQLWGRVLAGEIKSPGHYSLRTLEFIKNLTQREAKDIEKLFSHSFINLIIKSDGLEKSFDDEVIANELNYTFLSEMQSLGLISGFESLGVQTTFISKSEDLFIQHFIYNEKVMTVTNDNAQKKLEISVFLFTPLAVELSSLCKILINSHYLNFVIKYIKGKGFKVTIGDLTTDENGQKFSSNNVEV